MTRLKAWFENDLQGIQTADDKSPAESQFRLTNLLIACIFILVLLVAIAGAYVDKHLSADGVYIFVSVLEWKSLILIDWVRQFGLSIVQWPLLAALYSGIRDIPTLRIIFGLGLLIPWLIAFFLSLCALRHEDKSVLIFFLISLISINLSSDYILAGEHQVMTVFSWPILFYLLRQSSFRWFDIAILYALLICFSRLYPTALAPATIFVMLAAVRLVATRSRSEKLMFLGVIVLSLVVIAISAFAIFLPRDTANRGLFFLAVLRTLGTPETSVTLAFLLPFFAGWYFQRASLKWLALGSLGIFLVFIFTTGHIHTATESFENRALTLYLLPLLMLCAIAIKQSRLRLERNSAILLAMFTCVMLTANLRSTYQWYEFRTEFIRQLLGNEGFIAIETTGLLESPAVWPWNNSLLSIVWWDGCIKSIIQDADSDKWQPLAPPEYFWLSEYSCYSQEFSQFNSELCTCK